jgi:hypothetical protein
VHHPIINRPMKRQADIVWRYRLGELHPDVFINGAHLSDCKKNAASAQWGQPPMAWTPEVKLHR